MELTKQLVKKSLLATVVLSGTVGLGYVGGQLLSQQKVSAESGVIQTGTTDMYQHILTNSKTGVRIGEMHDYFGPISLNGRWLWCIEPTIGSDAGYTYHSGGDIMRTNYTFRKPRLSENKPLEFDETAPTQEQRTVTALLPYVILDMPIDQVETLFRARSGDADKMLAVVRGIRTAPDYVKFTTVQLAYWQFTGSGLQSPGSINAYSGAGATEKAAAVNRAIAMTDYGLQAGRGGGLNETWLMHWFHRVGQEIDYAINTSHTWKYDGGAEIWYSDARQRMVTGSSGRMSLNTGYIRATKEFSTFKDGKDIANDSYRQANPEGIKIGVYRNTEGTDKVGELTIGSDGRSATMEVQPGAYYLYELDVNGNPIKSEAQAVVNRESGYNSGRSSQGTYYARVDVTANNTANSPAVGTFVNTPEVVNFSFVKRAADDKIAALEGVDNQYTRVGAVYTLYYDQAATQPVTRQNGQTVTATVGDNGYAEFNDLRRGVYWVKETKVPTDEDGNSRFDLDTKVYKVDLTNVQTNETLTSDSTNTVAREYKLDNAFTSEEEMQSNNGSLIIQKKDADTNQATAQGHATLEGAEFKVEFYEAESLGTSNPIKKWEAVYRTDANGRIDVRNRSQLVSTTDTDKMNKLFEAYEGSSHEWGAYDYRVRETKAPNGYKLSTEVKDFVVKNLGSYRQSNFTWNYGSDTTYADDDLEIELYKRQRTSGDWQTNQNVSIQNATFKLTRKADGSGQTWEQTVKTDANGKLIYHGVPAGQYLLQETSVDKYQTNGQTIELTVSQQDGTTKLTAQSTSHVTDRNGNYEVGVQQDGDINVVIDNTPKETSAVLTKANEKGARLEGAVFKLVHYAEDGSTKLDEKNITTNANGQLDFSELKIGHWYTIEEIQAPRGYKLPAKRTTLKFRAEAIPAKNSYAVSYQTIVLDKTNENNKTSVASSVNKITTEDQVHDGLSFTADENQGTMALQFSFVNNTWQKLPATGSFVGPLVGVAAVVLVIGSTVFYFRKQED